MMKFAVVYIGATFIVFFFPPLVCRFILGVLGNVITPRLCEFLVTDYYSEARHMHYSYTLGI